MRIQSCVLSFFLLFLANIATAQELLPNQVCGYTGKSSWLEWYQRNKHELVADRGNDTTWLYVPVTVQITGNDDGKGHYKLENVIRAMCNMNSQYEQARIRFYFVPGDAVRYLNNSAWHNHEFYPGGEELIEENKIPGRLNAFVVSDPAGNCGYAWRDAIVLGASCSGYQNTTWAHEAGHHLSLPHPFVGWEGFEWDYHEPAPEQIGDRFVEKTDSSNCDFAADGFCDTDPDYLHDRWPCDDDKSTTVQTDPNGIEFRSDATLIMGYAYDNCASRFSPEQIAAMRANLNDEHEAYILQNPPFTEIDDNEVVELVSPIDSQSVQYNGITLHWKPVPNATYYVVEVASAPNFTPRFFTQTYYKTTSANVTGVIPNNRVMQWRVRAYNEWDLCQPSDSIQTGIFKTKNLTATNDLERVISAELSPNPVAAGLPALLTITTEETMESELRVSDAAGRLCHSQHIRLSIGENRIEIPTDGFSTGFYVVSLQNEKGALIKRLAITD